MVSTMYIPWHQYLQCHECLYLPLSIGKLCTSKELLLSQSHLLLSPSTSSLEITVKTGYLSISQALSSKSAMFLHIRENERQEVVTCPKSEQQANFCNVLCIQKSVARGETNPVTQLGSHLPSLHNCANAASSWQGAVPPLRYLLLLCTACMFHIVFLSHLIPKQL